MSQLKTSLNKNFFLILILLSFPLSVMAQNASVSGAKPDYNQNAAVGTVSNNYNAQRGAAPPTSILANKPQQYENQNFNLISAPGTGEYFLVPVIVRKDPEGSAKRFNTSGAAILSLLDKKALGGLTDESAQPLTVNTVLKIAESRFRTAAEYQPGNYLYHMNLASALYRQGKIAEALQSLRHAMTLKPNDAALQDYEEKILRVKVTVRVLDDIEVKK